MGARYICICTLYAVMVHNDSPRERGQLARGGCRGGGHSGWWSPLNYHNHHHHHHHNNNRLASAK